MNKNNVIGSVLLAFYICIPSLVLIPPAIVPSLEGRILAPMYLLGFVGCLSSLFFNKRRLQATNRNRPFILAVFILLFYFISVSLAESSLSFTDLFCYCVAPLLLSSSIDVDIKTVLRAMLILPSAAVFYTDKIFVLGGYYETSLTIGTCYAFLTTSIASIVYLAYYWKNDTKIVKTVMTAFILTNFVFLFYCIIFGSRGPLLSIILLLISLYFLKYDNGKIRVNTMSFLLVVILLLIVYNIFLPSVGYLVELLSRYGISVTALNKIMILNDSMDITNGRNEITSQVATAVWDNPLFGHGISSSERVLNINYPHNCILQTLFDGGILLFILLWLPILNYLKKWFNDCNNSGFVIVFLFLFAAFPGALVSGDMWRNPRLWFFVGFLLSHQTLLGSTDLLTSKSK